MAHLVQPWPAERPHRRQWLGAAVASSGLCVCIGTAAYLAIRPVRNPVPPVVTPRMVAPAGAGDDTPDGVWILNQETLEWRVAAIAEVKRGDVFDREIFRGKRERLYAIRDIAVWPGTGGKSYSMQAAIIGTLYTDDGGNARYIGEDHRDFITRMNLMYPGVLPPPAGRP